MDAINLDNISMRFNKSAEQVDTLKEYFVRILRRNLYYEEFWALENVSLSVSKGEIFGIVGLNGSGKSTLLKIVAGVLKPTKGIVQVEGTIAPLIELGAGFDADLTAKENIYMNGAILGYSTEYMKSKYEEIVNFAELWDFVNVPVKNFSSGMYARLGFAIATIVNPDILIVDEILGVGDYRFQNKCFTKIQEMMDLGITVLMVSHSKDMIKKFCNRVAWLENGHVKMIGDAEEIIEQYERI